jgi:hypothetical protein
VYVDQILGMESEKLWESQKNYGRMDGFLVLLKQNESCEREFSSLQGKVSFALQPSNAFFLICKREKIPFAKESRSHDKGHIK